jgi:hypothetical protein
MLSGLIVGLSACGGKPSTDRTVQSTEPIKGQAPFVFAQVDDNIRHDTLLIQTTFDLGDSTYIMVASNVEETFEGLRLYRYRFFGPDSAFEMMAVSTPAYDSWTMLPTFFGTDSTDTHALWVLANFGEKESWGQKLLWLDWDFTDMGFLEVALPERVMEEDTLRLKRRNIGPFTRVEERQDSTYFRFACDSVFLYDDQAGSVDQVLPSSAVHYTFHRDGGLVLWINGEARALRKPA